MKFKVHRATLLKALSHVQSGVERRNPIPILANFMIAVRAGKRTLPATDMEIAILEDAAADSARNGASPAPAATLYEIVRKLPDGAMAWVSLTRAACRRYRAACVRAVRLRSFNRLSPLASVFVPPACVPFPPP